MTTVAYCNGVMASDSCWTGDDESLQEVSQSKIQRLSSGALLGGSGDNDAREITELLDRVKTVKQLPHRHELLRIQIDYSGILVLPTGHVFKVVTCRKPEDAGSVGLWECNRGMIAAGTGSHLAIGNMGATADARAAVAFACRWDINSRLPVHSLELREAKEKPKRAKKTKRT